MTNEQRHEKICLRGFRPGPTQTGLYNHRRWLEALNFRIGKKRDCTIYVVKTKALICGFVFTYTKSRFSHDAAQMIIINLKVISLNAIACMSL